MKSQADSTFPTARAEGLLVESVGEETVVYDTTSKHAHCLSPLAAAVFARCDGTASLTQIADQLRVSGMAGVGAGEVASAVAMLEERGLLVAPPIEITLSDGGSSRREMLRRTAVIGAAAASVPLITSIVAPTAALAAGVCNVGVACAADADCMNNGVSDAGGTCSCGPCTSKGQKVCSLHNGTAPGGKCSEPCLYGGAVHSC